MVAPFAMPAIKVPVFPEREFVVTDFGAMEGGKTNISEAIHKAIAALPHGGWRQGRHSAWQMADWKSSSAKQRQPPACRRRDALFSAPEDYFAGGSVELGRTECFNYSPLIYAFGCTNVALTGKGTIEARLDIWKQWFTRPPAHLGKR